MEMLNIWANFSVLHDQRTGGPWCSFFVRTEEAANTRYEFELR